MRNLGFIENPYLAADQVEFVFPSAEALLSRENRNASSLFR